ncbi:MAG: SRPBCC domain-containing protein [Verrucomicrobiales bacterium]
MNNQRPPLDGTSLQITSVRVFAVPREKLFGMFTNPSLLARWWGPKGFSNTFHEFDFRPGGKWRFVMHAPNGAEYPIDNRFMEVVEPEKIVIKHIQEGHNFTMTLTYEVVAEGTRLNWDMVFEDRVENAKYREFIQNANEENFDRLNALLAENI